MRLREPTWSPESKHIAVSNNGRGIMWILDVGGGKGQALGNPPIEGSEEAWSPKGNRIAFVPL